MRAPAGFHRPDPLPGQRFVAHQELRVLASEDVVGHHAEADLVAQGAAERQHQRGLAAADRTADSDGERAGTEVAAPGDLPLMKVSRVIGVLVIAFVSHACLRQDWNSRE